MSNLLACILACISVRDKHDEGIKKMCSTGMSFGRSKLLQSCSNVTLKPELKPTVTACLACRDAQEVLYTGFVHYTEQRFKAIATLTRHLQCRYSKDLPFRKHIIPSWMEFSMVCKERAEVLVKTTRWAFWQLFIILLCFHYSLLRLANVLFFVTITVLVEVVRWKGLVYSHETDLCLS